MLPTAEPSTRRRSVQVATKAEQAVRGISRTDASVRRGLTAAVHAPAGVSRCSRAWRGALTAAALAAALLAPRAGPTFAASDHASDVPTFAANKPLAAGSAFAADDQAPDYAIPSGAFFTEALPDHTDGAGFAIQDGHGVKLWTTFQAMGGVPALGYPLSRRFAWGGTIAQAFQAGILRVDPATGASELVSPRELPGGRPPGYALLPDLPPRASAELETKPWSGWWWPASEGEGPTYFWPDSPLDKYDRYVKLVTGEDPATRRWERQSIFYPSSGWAGHCNGFAAAALLEPEPTEPHQALGITFTVGDLKGLLTDYHFGDAAAWSFPPEGDPELSAGDFHRMLLSWLETQAKGFVVTFDLGGGQLWSYPAYRFESEWGPDPDTPDVWHVKTTLWMADMNVPLNFVGTKPYPGPDGQTFEYTLEGDPRSPTDGTWTGGSGRSGFAHPGRIWYPEPSMRNVDRELTSPNLDRQTVLNIFNPSARARPGM